LPSSNLYAKILRIFAYRRFDGRQSLSANIRRQIFQRLGLFRSEPVVLIDDLVRETRNYEATLRAVAMGHHTPSKISQAFSTVQNDQLTE
jgi:hypothetical protein